MIVSLELDLSSISLQSSWQHFFRISIIILFPHSFPPSHPYILTDWSLTVLFFSLASLISFGCSVFLSSFHDIICLYFSLVFLIFLGWSLTVLFFSLASLIFFCWSLTIMFFTLASLIYFGLELDCSVFFI